jgi:hypothetical protein
LHCGADNGTSYILKGRRFLIVNEDIEIGGWFRVPYGFVEHYENSKT